MKTLLLALVLFSAAAGQTPSPQEAQHEEDKCCCSTYDTGQCLIAVEKKVNAELEDTYQRALERWKEPSDRGDLKKAQNAWVAYRDANCDAESHTYRKGTMGPNMSGFCRIRLARQRFREIRRIYLPEH